VPNDGLSWARPAATVVSNPRSTLPRRGADRAADCSVGAGGPGRICRLCRRPAAVAPNTRCDALRPLQSTSKARRKGLKGSQRSRNFRSEGPTNATRIHQCSPTTGVRQSAMPRGSMDGMSAKPRLAVPVRWSVVFPFLLPHPQLALPAGFPPGTSDAASTLHSTPYRRQQLSSELGHDMSHVRLRKARHH